MLWNTVSLQRAVFCPLQLVSRNFFGKEGSSSSSRKRRPALSRLMGGSRRGGGRSSAANGSRESEVLLTEVSVKRDGYQAA